MDDQPRSPLAQDVLNVLVPLAAGLAAMLVLRLVSGTPNGGLELMLGLCALNAAYAEFVYFGEVNRFDSGHS